MTVVEPLYAEIGTLLMCHRHTHGISQEDAADTIGLTRTSVANIECGRQRIMLHTLVCIAGLLGTEPGTLLTEALQRVHRKKMRGSTTRRASRTEGES